MIETLSIKQLPFPFSSQPLITNAILLSVSVKLTAVPPFLGTDAVRLLGAVHPSSKIQEGKRKWKSLPHQLSLISQLFLP